MVYFDKSGRRVRRPLRRRPTPNDPGVDEAKTRYILEVVARHPRFTAEEVYAVIYYRCGRHDITKAMVRSTLASHRSVPVRRRGRGR